MSHVILCTPDGKDLGTAEVDDAHSGEGTLHKAFSVFVFRRDGSELLLQKRSDAKSRFSGLWVNTCCSHPQNGEDITESAEKRLQEEMGFTCPLKEIGSFVYQADDPQSEFAEYEYDTVLMGMVNDDVSIEPDPAEVSDVRWITLDDLMLELDEKPEHFAPWFSEALAVVFGENKESM